jgi:hypothetical protein
MRRLIAAAAALAISLFGQPALASNTITDPVGDFIPSYAGPPNEADLDVTSFTVNFDGTNFLFNATMAGAIGSGTGFYVIGVDRGGSGASPFTSIGHPGVIFNAVIVLQQDSTGVVTISGVNTPLAAGAVAISGSTISAIVPLTFLPSTGFTPLQYGFDIWPRTTATTGNPAIADFAPDNSTITAEPEPATWARMLLGLGGVGARLRWRRRSPAKA